MTGVGFAGHAGPVSSGLFQRPAVRQVSPGASRPREEQRDHRPIARGIRAARHGSSPCGVRTGSVRMLSVPSGPRSDAGHAVHRDVGDVSGWGVIHWREADPRTEVGVSELLQQLGSSSLGNARRAIDHEVLV
jgi:hypothetical protein